MSTVLAQSGAELALPTTPTAAVVLLASLLAVAGWLVYLYR